MDVQLYEYGKKLFNCTHTHTHTHKEKSLWLCVKDRAVRVGGHKSFGGPVKSSWREAEAVVMDLRRLIVRA